MGTCCLDSSNPAGRGKNSCWNLQQPWSMSSHARGLYIHPGSFLNGDFHDSSHTLCKIRLYMYTFYLSALMIRCLAKLTFQQVSIDLLLRISLDKFTCIFNFLAHEPKAMHLIQRKLSRTDKRRFKRIKKVIRFHIFPSDHAIMICYRFANIHKIKT